MDAHLSDDEVKEDDQNIQQSLLNVYQNVLQLNESEINIMVSQGDVLPLDIETMTDNTLKVLSGMSNDFRASRIERFKAFRTWMREQDAAFNKGEIKDINLYRVTPDVLRIIMLRGSVDEEGQKKDMRVKISAVEPGTFDGSDEGFEKFKQGLSADLGQAELLYVIRHKKSARKNLPGFQFLDDATSMTNESVYTLPDAAYEPETTSEKFKKDNMLVYNMLRAKCTGGPASELVKEYEDSQDGRTTWIKICAWYDEDSVTARWPCRPDLNYLSSNIQIGVDLAICPPIFQNSGRM